MPDVTKAVRLSPKEWALIQRFLQRNPIFDFSTLARAALAEFVKKPSIDLHGVEDTESVSPVRQAISSKSGEYKNDRL